MMSNRGFAFTYHKLQGATLEKLILVLNDGSKPRLGPMSINKLYVTLKRVRLGKNLAVFPTCDGGIDYLKKLRY